MTELEAFAILASIPHLGAVKIRFLLEHFGSAIESIKATSSNISQLTGFERVLPHWQSWQKNPLWQRDIELAHEYGVQLIPFTDPQFPKRLLEIGNHPALLYVQGTLKPQDQRSIAIVGTRNSSIYGNEMAETIAQQLTAQGITVVSGLARGIDTAAHRGALKNGRTQAVIGSGLARLYPSENKLLAKEISEQGAVISEFAMSTPPDRQNFPQRNRIVSGMTMGTLLIEAPIKSGAMITMRQAITQKRKLFALPGRVDSDSFCGNHLLIKNGEAHLIENANDILSHFEMFFSPPSFSKIIKPHLDSEELALLQQMPNEEIAIDTLVSMTSIPIRHMNRILMSLVLKKSIREFPGKIYKKVD